MPSRHKSLVLLAGVILLQVLLLAVQIKRDSQGRLIRSWTVGAVSPFERAGSYVFGSFRDTWRNYFALRNTKRDNDDLHRENDAKRTDRKSTRLNSSHVEISYAVFCLKKKKKKQ